MSANDNFLWNCSFSQANKEGNKQLFNPKIENFSISNFNDSNSTKCLQKEIEEPNVSKKVQNSNCKTPLQQG